MIAVAAVLGAGFGLGVTLMAMGVRGRAFAESRFMWRRLRLLARKLAVALTCGVVVGLLTGWPIAAVLACGVGAVSPEALRRRRAQRRSIARLEAIAAWAEMLRDTMAGAAGLESALVATAPAVPLAIREEVQRLAASLTNERLAPALRQFADDVADATCDLVVAALLMAAEHQGRQLGELLGALAAAAREEVSVRLRVEAERARIRSDLQIIVVTVGGFITVLLLADRSYYSPYDSPLGQLVLAGIAGVFAAAFALLVRLGRTATTDRLLLGPREGR